MVQFWTRNVRKPEPTKPVKSTVWRDLITSTRLLPEFQGHSVLERIQFHSQKERSGSRVWDGPGGSGQTGEVVEADDADGEMERGRSGEREEGMESGREGESLYITTAALHRVS